MGVESGTCNVCSSPCKSCMHNNRTLLDMESKEDCGSSCNRLPTKEDDSYSSTCANQMPHYKKPFTRTEANKLLGSSSRHDSCSQKAKRASIRAYATCEKIEDVEMSPVNETNWNQSLEKTNVATDFSHRKDRKQYEDIMSCLTENKDSNVEVCHYSIGLDNKNPICSFKPNADIKNIVKVEATNCFPGSDVEESQSNCRRYIAHSEDSLKECDSVSSAFDAKPNPLLFHNGYDGRYTNDRKSSDNGLSSQANDCKSTLKTQIVEHKYREGKTSTGPWLIDENRLDKDVSSQTADESTAINKEFEMSCLLDESYAKESQQVIDCGNCGTENELTDVNVCDVCGDVGREYLLAVCSNCGDGAEHTYCMRNMLRKLPEGDWLCETCQLKKQTEKETVENHKEAISTTKKCKLTAGPEITKMDNLNTSFEKSKECTHKRCSNTKRDMNEEIPETSKLIKKKFSSTPNLRTISKFDKKPMDPDRKKLIGKLQSPNSAKRHAEYQEVLSPNSRPPDTSGRYVEKGSPRKKPCLSREASFKNLDGRKERTASISVSNGGQNTNKIPSISRSQSMLGSHLSKVSSSLQSPRSGFISRSSSCDINPTSKVKQYAEDVPFNKEVTESSLSEQRRNAILGSKSTSFRGIGNKMKLYESPRSLLLHKTESMENKHNPTTDHLPASPKASTSIDVSKINMKTTMSNVKAKHHIYEPKRQRLDKGSSDANDISKTFSAEKANDIRNKSSMKHSEDQRLCHSPRAHTFAISIKEPVQSNSIVKISEPATCKEIPKAASVAPKKVVSNTLTLSCSTDKLKSSGLEPCSENNSKDDGIKRNRWKDAVKKTFLKAKSQTTTNNNGLDNQLTELPLASNDISYVVEPSHGNNIISTISEDSPSVEVAYPSKDVRSPETIDLNAIASASDDMVVQASQHANPHMTLAIPSFEYIWQGSFEVLNEVESAPYFGIQAHLSTSASPKVHEMTTKFPTEVLLEEAPWTSSWPTQFQDTSPDENNIALFFFAKDIESYEKSYSKLLEKMLKNDLSLKGIIDGIELLIFPSTKLPARSQRWNRLFFLWGVFRARRHNNGIPKSSYQKKPLSPILKFDPKSQDFPLTPKIEDSNCKLLSCAISSACIDNVVTSSYQKKPLSPILIFDPKSQDYPLTPKIEDSNCKLLSCAISSACIDNVVTSSSTPKVEEISCVHKSPCSDQNPSSLSSSYNRPLNNQNSSFLSSPYSVRLDHSNPASYFCGNSSNLSNKTFSLPESRFQMTNAPPCSELKNDSSNLKNLDPNIGVGSATSTRLPSPNVQIWHSRELHPHPTLGTENIRNKTKDREIPVRNEYILYDECHKKQENRPNTSHAGSFPINAVSQPNYVPLPSPTNNETVNLSSSSNAHPLFSTIFKPDNIKVADKDILVFPNSTKTLPNTRSGKVIDIISSDEEDALNPNKPNLELVLWNKQNSKLEEKWKMTDADDEDSAALSLSLAIPATSNGPVKMENDLQGNSKAKAPLRLFGKSIGI